jgi:hypothetical protein
MIAPVVAVAFALDWWPRFLALAEHLGAAVEELPSGEAVVFTGRSLAGVWVVV